MKYLTVIMGLFLVLTFAGCDKAKDNTANVKDSATEALKSTGEDVKEAVKDAKCGEGKCGEGKCGGDAKEAVSEKVDAAKEAKCGEGKCG